VVRIGHEETRRLLLRDDDRPGPLPEITFADRYTLQVGGERVELAWQGPNHTPDNIYIHFPDHDNLDVHRRGQRRMGADHNLNLSEDVSGTWAPRPSRCPPVDPPHQRHLGRLATAMTCDPPAVHRRHRGQRAEALAAVNPVPST